ncbi:MAG: hypothetical protein IPF92_14855 [Myxococcales bacterium]|nr:hypothetical protein [Myxococcales bacterium]MBL0195155.1 hypothetical protein [Myxococcales bacterium]HQY64869.1 hypothetical protein [Polyangiaceae bacterium]
MKGPATYGAAGLPAGAGMRHNEGVPTPSRPLRDLTRRLVPAAAASLLASVLLAGCVKKDPPAPEPAPSTPPAPPSPPTAAPAPSASAHVAKRVDASAPRLAAADKAKLLAELQAGRSLAKAEKWPEARAALGRALALDPGNAAVLSELSWVDIGASDWTAAIDHATLAVKNAGDARLRAQALYNLGRGYEGKGELMEAVVRYRASLAKRPNAAVQKRLDALLAQVKRDMVPKPAPRPQPVFCARRFAEDLALFQCLERVTDEAFNVGPLVASSEPVAGLVPPFRVVRFGNEGPGLGVFMLVRKTSGEALEPVAELARTWNPGAFGINEEYTYLSSKEAVFGKRRVVEVHGRREHGDADYAGLMLTTETTESVTVCAYEGDEPMSCVGPLALSTTEALAYPHDPKDLGPEDVALLAGLRKERPPSTVTARADLAVTAEGVTVTLASGPKELLTSLGSHPFR